MPNTQALKQVVFQWEVGNFGAKNDGYHEKNLTKFWKCQCEKN